MAWMAWTWPTAAFFAFIAAMLLLFSWLGVKYPETPRKGILQIRTTRGDRLFISLLGSAYICLAWLGLFGPPLWGALIVCLVYWALVFTYV